ncbi:serine acetyltransferase, partial [Striga asiatica]
TIHNFTPTARLSSSSSTTDNVPFTLSTSFSSSHRNHFRHLISLHRRFHHFRPTSSTPASAHEQIAKVQYSQAFAGVLVLLVITVYPTVETDSIFGEVRVTTGMREVLVSLVGLVMRIR